MARPPLVDPDYWRLLGGQTPETPETDLYAIRNTTTTSTKAASDAHPFPAGMTTATVVDGSRLYFYFLFNITCFVPLAEQTATQVFVTDQSTAWCQSTPTQLNGCSPEDFDLKMMLVMPWGNGFRYAAYEIPRYWKKRDIMLVRKALIASGKEWGQYGCNDGGILQSHDHGWTEH